MKKFLGAIMPQGRDICLLAGAILVAMGAGLIYLPAGLIVGGILMMAGAVFASLGDGDGL